MMLTVRVAALKRLVQLTISESQHKPQHLPIKYNKMS